MKFNKKSIYIGLFGILYLIVAFSSFFHACAFFGLANNSWMSIILAFAFEVGQAAVLFSLLTSSKDRSRIMPWVLMTMFTLVQVIGNVYSSYKYIITNSVENLKYFKEPIFIWTDLPDAQANVIIVYLVGAMLPIAALLLTSMITNYLSDQSEETNASTEISEISETTSESGQENNTVEIKNNEEFLREHGDKDEEDGSPESEGLSDKQVIDNLNATLDNRDEEINNLKKELENLRNNKTQFDDENLDVKTNEDETVVKDETTEDNPSINIEKDEENNDGKEVKKDSHFINL